MSRIYFAAPLFSAAEKDFNLKLCKIFEDAGYEVFLPQRDGVLAAETENKSEAEIIQTVFKKDTSELAKSDILIFMTDGRVPDEGACVELGIAYASGKRCYGIRTDARALENVLSLNPLIAGCFKKIFFDYDCEKLFSSIKEYLAVNKL